MANRQALKKHKSIPPSEGIYSEVGTSGFLFQLPARTFKNKPGCGCNRRLRVLPGHSPKDSLPQWPSLA